MDLSSRSADTKPVLLEPPSWTSKLSISSDLIKSVYPEGSKTVFYSKCNVEKFAPHSPGKQGLVLRLTLFEDSARQVISEIREIFEQRKDNLFKRVTIPSQSASVSWEIPEFIFNPLPFVDCVKLRYSPGKPSGIQDFIEIPGVSLILRFYPKSRVDGLVTRTETINKKGGLSTDIS